MTDAIRLERAYGRLLVAYPRGYRRERGREILTTLLEAAEPEQRRPTVRDAIDLLIGGVRCRFRAPRGAAYRTVAVIVTLFAGLLTSAAAGLVTWKATVPEVTEAQARAVAQTATSMQRTVTMTANADPLRLDWRRQGTADPAVPAGRHPANAFTFVDHEPRLVIVEQGGTARWVVVDGQRHEVWLLVPVDAAIAEARQRLADAGWQTGTVRHGSTESVFWAAKGDLVVRVSVLPALATGSISAQAEGDLAVRAEGSGTATEVRIATEASPIMIAVHRNTSHLVTVVAVTGLLLGLPLGWLCAAWALRRYRASGLRGKVAILALGVPGLLAVAALIVMTLVGAVLLAAAGGWSPQDSLLPAAILRLVPPLSMLAGGFVVAAALAAAIIRPSSAGSPVEGAAPVSS